MPIKAKCPNPTCGKTLTAKDEFAGKRAKCPACGGPVPLPGGPTRASAPAPAKRREPAVVPEDEEEPREEEREEAPTERKPRKVESNLASILLFIAAIVLIVLAAFAPSFPWMSISMKEGEGAESKNLRTITIGGTGAVDNRDEVKGTTSTGELSSDARPEGRLIMIVCLAVAVVLTAGFILAVTNVLARKPSEQILNATLLAGLAWGIVLTVWGLAWLWKVVTFSHGMQKGLDEVRIGERTAEFAVRPFPGAGVFILVLAGVFIAFLLSQVASRLNKLRKQMFLAEQMKGMSRQAVERLYMGHKLLRVAEAVGILLGALILVLVVKPWDAGDLWKGIEPLIRLK
jgi:hypothetical protein